MAPYIAVITELTLEGKVPMRKQSFQSTDVAFASSWSQAPNKNHFASRHGVLDFKDILRCTNIPDSYVLYILLITSSFLMLAKSIYN